MIGKECVVKVLHKGGYRNTRRILRKVPWLR
jgi:hypothetical protein